MQQCSTFRMQHKCPPAPRQTMRHHDSLGCTNPNIGACPPPHPPMIWRSQHTKEAVFPLFHAQRTRTVCRIAWQAARPSPRMAARPHWKACALLIIRVACE